MPPRPDVPDVPGAHRPPALPVRRTRRTTPLAMAALAAGATLAAAPLRAQTSGSGFLFGAPAATLTVRAGYDVAAAGSELFDFARQQLTLGRRDFSGPALGAELAFRVHRRVELTLDAAMSSASARSEYRAFVGSDDLPIEQTTSFRRIPVSVGVKAYLAPTGREVGSFAWVPARFAPYVGAGVGAVWYRFRQEGEFIDVDSPDLDVFATTFSSGSAAPLAHARAGFDVALSPRVALTTEARYQFARAQLDRAFVDFDRIDLSGLAATAGVSLRF